MSPGSGNSVLKEAIKKPLPRSVGAYKEITVLDGGFASQLSCHVDKPIDGDVLWSARFLATDPEAVIETHLDFLRGMISNFNCFALIDSFVFDYL